MDEHPIIRVIVTAATAAVVLLCIIQSIRSHTKKHTAHSASVSATTKIPLSITPRPRPHPLGAGDAEQELPSVDGGSGIDRPAETGTGIGAGDPAHDDSSAVVPAVPDALKKYQVHRLTD